MQLRCLSWFWISLTLVLGITEVRARTTQAIENTWNICPAAVNAAERLNAIPLHLLRAISKAESGRWHEEKQVNIAWPWTVTSGAAGKFFDTKAEAVAEVEFLMTKGVRNIDVGCMQINLKAHANAFATIEDAFDPAANAAYGGKYLKTMHRRTSNWLKAAGSYHSMTPHLGIKYRAKVGRIWNELRGQPAPVIETSKRDAADDQTDEKPKARRYRASEISYRRLNRLNQNFRQRRGLSAKALTADPHTRRANARQQQMTAWRNAQARGQDLSVLAGIRQAERAKRRQRERVAFGKQDRQTVFAQRRHQQLNDWRARFDKGWTSR
jgi:hypothetical protein